MFEYKNSKVNKATKQTLPLQININAFARKKIISYAAGTYDLSPETKMVINYRIHLEVNDEDYEKYLLGDKVLFTWTDTTFRRNKISFYDTDQN